MSRVAGREETKPQSTAARRRIYSLATRNPPLVSGRVDAPPRRADAGGMKTACSLFLAAVAWCFLATAGARAEGTVTFEVHAVADHPGLHTRAYLGVEAGADGKAESALLVEPPLLDGAAVQFASLNYDEEGKPVILLNLTPAGARRFEQITHDRVGQQLGLVLGGQLYALPRIVETIHGGKIAISGSFTQRQAGNLVERLNSSLPAKGAER